jgi:hypothetical protein
MPTSVTQELDTTNLDFFYANYSKSFGIGFHEDTPNKPKPIPPNINPAQCLIKDLRGSSKTTHFFKAPNVTSIVKCFCRKFHTNFISQSKHPYNLDTQNFSPVTSNKKTKNLVTNIMNSVDLISPSPVTSPSPTTHTHQCLFCNLNINCKITNNTHYLESESTTYQNIPCHKSCLDEQNNQVTSNKQSFIDRLKQSSEMEIDSEAQTTREISLLALQQQEQLQQEQLQLQQELLQQEKQQQEQQLQQQLQQQQQ